MTSRSDFTPSRSGVYRRAADLDALRATARAAGAAWLDADLSPVRGKAQLLRVFAGALGFPKTFGHNWDALADSLEDLSWCPASAYVLDVRASDSTRRALGDDWRTLLEILAEAASYWASRGKAFVAFVEDGDAAAWK